MIHKKKEEDITKIEKRLENFKSDLNSAENLKNNKHGFLTDTSATKILLDLSSGLGIGVVVGYFIDYKLNTLPVFIFLCSVFGIAGGFLNMYRDLNKNNLDKDD